MALRRYQRNSEACEKLAQSLHHLTTVEERGLFDFGSRGQEASPLVLILDRKDDPVTPLLLQWTYQAMVHELIGLDTNRVDLSHIPGVSSVCLSHIPGVSSVCLSHIPGVSAVCPCRGLTLCLELCHCQNHAEGNQQCC